MGAGMCRTRAVHDAGPGVLLRGHGAFQERAQHADDELLVPPRDPGAVGRGAKLYLTARLLRVK